MIRRIDDALVDTVTTGENGNVFVSLEDGSYYAKEVTSNKSFRLDDTPHYFEIKDGKRVTLQVTNKKLSGIVIHKIDSATGEGIYGVKFVLYDANKKPIGEYTSDDRGYIYIDEIPGGLSGRFYLRELETADGYILDKQYKKMCIRDRDITAPPPDGTATSASAVITAARNTILAASEILRSARCV